MDRNTITQEYFALTTDKNGNIPPMRKDQSNAGIVVAGFMDLLLNDIVIVDNKKIIVEKELPKELEHLITLYNYLNEKSRNCNKMMSDFYVGSNIKQLTTQVGESLVSEGVASHGKGGMFGPKITYITQNDYREEMLCNIKTALKAESKISSHDIALIFILKETKNLQQYFSKHEYDETKSKLKEMKKDPQNKQLATMIHYIDEMITMMIAFIYVKTM